MNAETLRVPIAPDTHALVTITVEEEGLGPIDPPVRRRPGLTDLHLTIAAISAGKYTLEPQSKKQP